MIHPVIFATLATVGLCQLVVMLVPIVVKLSSLLSTETLKGFIFALNAMLYRMTWTCKVYACWLLVGMKRQLDTVMRTYPSISRALTSASFIWSSITLVFSVKTQPYRTKILRLLRLAKPPSEKETIFTERLQKRANLRKRTSK